MSCLLSFQSNHPFVAGIPNRNNYRQAAMNWEDLLPVPSLVLLLLQVAGNLISLLFIKRKCTLTCFMFIFINL